MASDCKFDAFWVDLVCKCTRSAEMLVVDIDGVCSMNHKRHLLLTELTKKLGSMHNWPPSALRFDWMIEQDVETPLSAKLAKCHLPSFLLSSRPSFLLHDTLVWFADRCLLPRNLVGIHLRSDAELSMPSDEYKRINVAKISSAFRTKVVLIEDNRVELPSGMRSVLVPWAGMVA